MTERVTREQVDAMAARLGRELSTLGMLGEGESLAVSAGSAANGVAWRLYVKRDGDTPRTVPGLNDRLGMTAREAREALERTSDALWAVALHGKQQQG